MNNSASRRGSWIKLALNLFLLALAVWLFLNRQFAFDSIRLLSYEPPVEIAALAEKTKMNELGKRYFYVAEPIIADRAAFNANCSAHHSEETIILGCYNGVNIFIYDINDPRLPGVKEVTSAHEMLHSAYDRLYDEEKSRVNAMLDSQAGKIKDERLLNLIEIYRKAQPSELHNEMHSIFATEVRELIPELEEYYKKYFDDRLAVVGFSESYEAVFGQLKLQQDTLIHEIDQLVAEIKRRTEEYNTSIHGLDQDIRTFNARAESGDFESQSEFNQVRAVLVSRVQALETERSHISSLRAAFERKKKELEAINLEVISLNQILDSTPADVPSIE